MIFTVFQNSHNYILHANYIHRTYTQKLSPVDFPRDASYDYYFFSKAFRLLSLFAFILLSKVLWRRSLTAQGSGESQDSSERN